VSVSDVEAAHVFSTNCPPASCIASTAPPAKFNIPDAHNPEANALTYSPIKE
jgi:hypothetical protein